MTMKRNLDGIFFRVKRNGKYENVCFTDLNPDEIERVGAGRSAEWWKNVALHLKARINIIGEACNLVVEYGDD
jgi:hypothetical protein